MAVRQVSKVLARPPSEQAAQAASAVVQNLCFESRNVGVVASAGVIPPLLALLSRARGQVDVAAAAAGALQSVVYRHDGRTVARSTKAASVLCGVLSRWLTPVPAKQVASQQAASASASTSAIAADTASNPGAAAASTDTRAPVAVVEDSISSLLVAEDGAVGRLLTRCAGAVHNLSCDPLAVVSLRESGALALFKTMLQLPVSAICASAAGAVQNMSREPKSRQLLRGQASTLKSLTAMLVGSAPEAQRAAAAALMNILAPSHRAAVLPTDPDAAPGAAGETSTTAGSRDPLRSALASLIGTAVGYGCLLPLLSAADSDGFQSVSRRFTGEDGSILELYDDAGRCTAFGGVLSAGDDDRLDGSASSASAAGIQ
jgi:hypothetical protein